MRSRLQCAWGLSLRPQGPGRPTMTANSQVMEQGLFDQMIANWLPLTYVLNTLSRGLGQADSYPFVLTQPVIDKLRFVHETIARSAHGSGAVPQ